MVSATTSTAAAWPAPVTESPAWAGLAALAARRFVAGPDRFDLRTAFAQDPQRAQRLSFEAPGVFADLSKNRIDAEVLRGLLALARERQVEARRDAMFAGEIVNPTEQRPAMHWLLRTPAAVLAPPHLRDAHALVHGTLGAMLAYAERVRADRRIRDIVNIGIGGSDLGPQMAVQALDALVTRGKRFHFVSNVDGHELAAVLRDLEPERTLFIVASKTFTTVETMTNAASARTWFLQHGGRGADRRIARHFVALTTNADAAQALGMTTRFEFWDWVGGRYSMWSAIGLPIAIAIGAEAFRGMLAGAHAMDLHFATAPAEANLPLLLGLVDVWNRNFLGFDQRNIAPYHAHLRRLPAYLQQLEMESNGKSVDLQGRPLACAASPTLWGEPGTNGQHAFFQMLHQGREAVPVEFIAVSQAAHAWPEHHRQLLVNAIAQAQALMIGREDAGGHRAFSGNRPSTFLVLQALTPQSLGALIALYEHRVFTSGAVWGINSFDQFGVELGKALAKSALDLLDAAGTGGAASVDGSTAQLLDRLCRPAPSPVANPRPRPA